MSERYELGGSVAPSAIGLRAPTRARAAAANPNVDRIVAGQIRIQDGQPSESWTAEAERFHELARAQEDTRRASIGDSYEALGRPTSVVLSLCGRRYLPLLETWLGSCDRRGIEVRDKTILMALDGYTQQRSHRLGLRSVRVDPAETDDIVEADRYGDSGFARVMLYKTLVAVDALAIVPRLLFQDVDLLWLHDPLEDLERRAQEADLLFMYDGPNPVHEPLYLNSGFFFAVANEATRSVFETLLRNSAYVLAARSQQRPLNRIVEHFLVHNLLRLKALPETRYLNGHLFNLETGISPDAGDWARDGLVLHYSWTADIGEKQSKLAKFGLS